MADDRWRTPPPAQPGPAHGPRPSARARARLAAHLGGELDLTRAAWDDAMLRSDERLGQRDEQGALEALEDQRRLLRLLEDRLGRVVASAAVERDAEAVLDDAETTVPTAPGAAGGHVAPAGATGAPPVADGAGGRVRALVAAGAATTVTAIAVGLSALVGPLSSPSPEVAGSPGGTATTATSDATGDADVAAAGQDTALPLGPASGHLPALPGWMLVEPVSPADDAGDDARADAPAGEDGTASASGRADDGTADGTAGDAAPGAEAGGDDGAARDRDDPGPDDDGAAPEEGQLLDLEPLLRSDDDEDTEGGEDADDEATEDEHADEDLPDADAGGETDADADGEADSDVSSPSPPGLGTDR